MNVQFGWGTFEDGWRKGPWTPQEDKLLIDHVNLHGEGRWNSVSKLTGIYIYLYTYNSFMFLSMFYGT